MGSVDRRELKSYHHDGVMGHVQVLILMTSVDTRYPSVKTTWEQYQQAHRSVNHHPSKTVNPLITLHIRTPT